MSRAGPSPSSGGRGVFPTPTCPRRSILRRQKPGRQGWLPAAGRGFREGRLFLTRGQGSAAVPRGVCEKGQPAVISGPKRSWVDTPLAPMMTFSRCLRKCPPRDPGVHHASGVAAAKAPRCGGAASQQEMQSGSSLGLRALGGVVCCSMHFAVGGAGASRDGTCQNSLPRRAARRTRTRFTHRFDAPCPVCSRTREYRAVSTPHRLNVLLRLSRVA